MTEKERLDIVLRIWQNPENWQKHILWQAMFM